MYPWDKSANLFKVNKEGILKCFQVTVDRRRVYANFSPSIVPNRTTMFYRTNRLFKAAKSNSSNALFSGRHIGI